MSNELGVPKTVDRGTFQAALDILHVREKAHTREGDAIAAARRRLPMVEVDAATPLIVEQGPVTLLDAFEGRQMLIAYYFMWHAGHPAPEQCEGCTFFTSQVRELSYMHARNVTYATFAQGTYEESIRYRDFMGWDEMPWYSAPQDSLDTLLAGRRVGLMYIVCYLRQRTKVFETYWTTRRGVEAMDNSYRLLDLTVYGRQEKWEDCLLAGPKVGVRASSACVRMAGRSPNGAASRLDIPTIWALVAADLVCAASLYLAWSLKKAAKLLEVPTSGASTGFGFAPPERCGCRSLTGEAAFTHAVTICLEVRQ